MSSPIRVSPIKESELEEAGRIVRVAFGTFLGLAAPTDFMDDRDLMTPRWHSPNVKVIAARHNGRLIGSNVVTRWGSFGFFGPLTVLPEYWDRGVGQKLLEATMKIFERWSVRHTGLYTFAHSAKHMALYQKFGYWPRYLTAIMTLAPRPGISASPRLLSGLARNERDQAIEACLKLTHKIDKGLDLTGEIQAVLRQRTGEVVLTYTRTTLDGFAVCLNGPGSEGGSKICYIKFAAARSGESFDRLLAHCEAFAASRNATIEAGVNLARDDAYRRMRAHGFRTSMQGVAMQRPHANGFNRGDVYIIDDWR